MAEMSRIDTLEEVVRQLSNQIKQSSIGEHSIQRALQVLSPVDSGDTAWMLAATALVLFMTMPGLAIYYSGMIREKNVLACKSHYS